MLHQAVEADAETGAVKCIEMPQWLLHGLYIFMWDNGLFFGRKQLTSP